jgi:chromosome partitioning protein
MSSIAIISQKGGVGKTTLALNLAVAFAERGERTLLVDLDPQGGIGHSLGRGDGVLLGLADYWSDRVGIDAVLSATKLPGLSLLARGRLDPVDVIHFEEAILNGALTGLKDVFAAFTRVVVDTPAGLGGVSRAALRVVDFALVPVQAEPLALRGLGQALSVVEHVRATENPGLALLGCVQTMADRHAEASLAVMNELWTDFPGVFETVIPRHEVFSRASLEGVPVGFLAGKPTPEARRFSLLAAEVDAAILSATGGHDVIQERRSLL